MQTRDLPLSYTVIPGQHQGTTILRLSGPLILGNIFDFQKDFREMKPGALILDLTDSPYMDSAGLGLIMNYYVSAERSGRRLLIAGANDRINALLGLTRVSLLLRLYPTVADAEADI